MKNLLMPFVVSTLLSVSAQAEVLGCLGRDQSLLGRGYEATVQQGRYLEVRFRGKTIVPMGAVRKVSVPTVGGQFRTDYISDKVHLIVSSKSGGDNGNYSMLTIRGVAGEILLYCGAIGR